MMLIQKKLAVMLIGIMAAVMCVIPLASATDIAIDLVPDGVEDSLCEGMEESTGGILSCEDSGDITSFTEFEGSFEAPSSEGYDSGLTKAKTAREYILNVTNFALSFLGIAAIVVIIYGGFLYVTAGGQEEQTTKGKKSVMYAVIGILVVLSSYAIVNTLLSDAAGGGEDRGEGSVYSSGDEVTGDQVDVYNVNQIAKDLQDMATEYIAAFTTYSNVHAYIEYAWSFETPDTEPVKDMFSLFDKDDYDADESIDQEKVALVREYVEIIDSVAQEIMDMVDRNSDTYQAASDLKAYTEKILYDARWGVMYSDNNHNWLIPVAYADRYEYGDFDTLQKDIKMGLKSVAKAASIDFNEKLDEYGATLTSYKTLFDATGSQAAVKDGGSTLKTIDDQIDTVLGYFGTDGVSRLDWDANKSFLEDSKLGDLITGLFLANSVLRDVITDLGTLYSLVENLEFVDTVITASVKEGSSPLIVSFDGLDSYDPSDLTIDSSQYTWDLDGDGKYESEGASVSKTYYDVGTYRVGLRVYSQDPDVAPGQAYISIVVNPPESNIVLKAYASSSTVVLANYEENIIESTAKFTEAEGTTGITISMAGTTDGNGDPTVYHTLDCGNGVESYTSESLIEEICTYPGEGSYTLKAEVTDVTGTTDRYVGTIVIASPAARIESQFWSGTPETVFSFDGSASKTDIGAITAYMWSAVSATGKSIDLGSTEDLSSNFDEPGVYTVSLTVTDSSGNQDTDTIDITVESQTPIAKFDYSIPDDSQPGTVHFDGGNSYDPDEGDTLSYLWTFDGTEGSDYEFAEGTDETSESPIVKFYEAGSHNVTLQVSDQYEDEDLKQTGETSSDIMVYSVLDVLLEMPSGAAHQLDDEAGSVEVSFTGSSDNAVAYVMDYGDGEDEAQEGSSSKTFYHTYTETGTYNVELTVYDDDDNENTYTKKVYIGDSNSTIAVISLEKDGMPVSSLNIEGNITTVFTFDASGSQNTNGTSRDLKYSWDFGDKTLSTEKTARHTYDELGTYKVTLTVSDKDDPSINSEDTFEIVVAEEPPEIDSLTYSIKSDSNVTPVDVKVEVDAQDPDGSIANYYWYYYDTGKTSEKLGAQITTTSSATLTIGTNGSTGDEKEYAIAVEVTDKAGNTVSSRDELDEDPTITVENGENEAPVADFSLSDTIIMLGDTVTLSSSSYDPDGDDLAYIWDLEGDGFSDNTETADATYVYEPKAVGCYDIRLKVADEKGQSTTSDKKIQLCVESTAQGPEAAFVYDVRGFDVDFTNQSTTDEANGADLYAVYWDFDTLVDSDGNGDAGDDADSKEQNPSHTYDIEGTYKVSLVIYDSAGQSDSVEQSILVADTDPPTAAFTSESEGLEVSFADNSSVAEDYIVITSYSWDFDTLVDSDGDGDPANDTDSVSNEPSYEYDDYGSYTVGLTVMDSMNKEDSVTNDIDLEEPVVDVIAYLTTNPEPSPSDEKIHITGSSGKIDISYSTNLDSGAGITCWLDKNVYFDTDGDGVRDNDHDLEDTTCLSGTFKDVSYESSWGLVVMMLTAESDTGSSYSVTKEVVFDSSGAANLFPVSSAQGLVLIMVATAFALLGASIYTVRKIN